MKKKNSVEGERSQERDGGTDGEVNAEHSVVRRAEDAMQTQGTPPHLELIDTRSEKVRRLRERYLQGTLDEVLIPDDADFGRLVAVVYPDGDLGAV